MSKQRIYSGTCICGHSWEEHHLSLVLKPEGVAERIERGEPCYWPSECLYYGSNERGGLQWDPDLGEYVDHCHYYVDVDDPERREEDHVEEDVEEVHHV